MAEYRAAPEVAQIARELIEEHHEFLENNGPRIEYLFTRPSTPGGKEQRFRLRKVTGVNAFLATRPLPDQFGFAERSFVVIEISQHFWRILTDKQARGLLDHLLSHLAYDAEKDAWSIEGPEFGEFPGVLERHGDWRPEDSFKYFVSRVSVQPSLLLELDDNAEEDFLEGANGEKVDAETGEVLETMRS